ncbi:MAG TPA: alpha/beta hydrolase, partial [Pseudonocardiaceae bacterium]|nr:alpha/beta hydrolase [Pseudonocardiaceae bacterium]
MVFGHSYGGLVALETTLRRPAAVITKLAVYEPAVSIDGTISNDWLPELDRAVAEDRTADGVVSVLRGLDLVGPLKHLPVRLQRAVTRAVMHGDTLADMRELLPTASEEVATATALDSSGAKYAGVGVDTLLMCGERGPEYLRHVAETLDEVIPQSRMAVLDKLSHNAPDLDAPEAVAVELRRYFGG